MAGHSELPAPVAEVPFDLATDGRSGVGAEAFSVLRVEVADGLEQADVADLQKVFGWFRAVAVGPDTGAHQPGVPGDEDLADRLVFRCSRGQLPQPGEQLNVGQRVQLSAG